MTMTISFTEIPLTPEMHTAIAEMGFQDASPIQAQAIPFLLEGRDVIGQAQTGTGKTAAFAIPLVERINPNKKQLQALVLCPTRELAVQVADQCKKLVKYKKGVSVVAIYGGEPIARQMRALERKPQIIVSTPGRLLDHMQRGSIRLQNVQTIVLDEADEMLDMGFRHDIESILKMTPDTRQTVLFSATLSRPILELSERYLSEPQFVKVEPTETNTQLIEQSYVEVNHRSKKLNTLMYLIDHYQVGLALVFCNTKRQVDDLVQRLKNEGYLADGLHGGMQQPKRDKVMMRFRKGAVKFLVATDVAARGIDVQNIEAVFNYDLPNDLEYYVHRIGRTGRAGNTGKAFTFVGKDELQQLKRIRRSLKSNMAKEELPATFA